MDDSTVMTEEGVEEPVLSEEEESVVVREVKDRLEEAASKRNDWANAALEDEQFRFSAQWTREEEEELKRVYQYPIVVNVIHPSVEEAKSSLTANPPKFMATGREDSDTKVSALFTDILSWIWYVSRGNLQLKQAIDDYYTKGLGYLFTWFDPNADYGKGEIYFSAPDPFYLFIDPASRDRLFLDASYMQVSHLITEDQLRNTYGRFAGKLLGRMETSKMNRYPTTNLSELKGFNIGFTIDETQEYYELIDEYRKVFSTLHIVTNPQTELVQKFEGDKDFQEFLQKKGMILPGPAGNMVLTRQDEMKSVMESVEAGQIQSDQIQVLTMGQMIEQGYLSHNSPTVPRIERTFIVGDRVLYRGILPIKDYPIVPIVNHHNRSPYPGSDVRLAKPVQKYVNKLRSLMIAHAANTANLKAWIPDGSPFSDEIEKKWSKPGAAVMRYDAEFGVPVVQGPPTFPAELFRHEAEARRDISEIFGIQSIVADSGAKMPDSYKGTVAADEIGQRRIRSKRDDVEESVNQLARIIVQMVQSYYTEKKTIRLVQPNFRPSKEIELNVPLYREYGADVIGKVNDITTGEYDVMIVSGSMLPSNRWTRLQAYIELYQIGIIDQVEVLRQTDVVDMEGVLERMNMVKKMQQQVAGMEQEIKRLNGDLQTAQRETVQANQRVAVSKFQTKLGTAEARVTGATDLYTKRLDDQLRMQRKEMDLLKKEIKAMKKGPR